MTIHVEIFVWVQVFNTFGQILSNMIAGSCDNMMFSFVRICRTIFRSECTILPSHQQWMRVHIAFHSHQHLVLPVFWILAIQTNVCSGISLLFLFEFSNADFSFLSLNCLSLLTHFEFPFQPGTLSATRSADRNVAQASLDSFNGLFMEVSKCISILYCYFS